MIIDHKQFKILKQKYEESKNNNKETFTFMDEEFVTSYAKYLIEYIESQMIDKKHETLRTF